MLALRLARRELRGGVRGLWIVLLCLALGVAVIAAVGSLRAATDRGLAEDGRRILGGDLEVESGSQPLPDALRDWLRARGASAVRRRADALDAGRAVRRAAVGRTEGRRSRLAAGRGSRTLGSLSREAGEGGGGGVAAALSDHGLLAEPVVLDRLNLHPGDTVRLGNASFTVRGALLSEPDRVAAPLILGPRVLIAADALPSTGLIAPGSMVQYAIRATLPDPAAALLAAALREAFPDQGWRIRDPHDAAPGVTRFIDQTSLFMTLVGLTSLLVGGHRRRQRRPRLARRPGAHHRDAALSRRLVRPGVGGLPDPGSRAWPCAASSSALWPARWRRLRWPPGSRTCCRCRRFSAFTPLRSLLAACYGLLTALAFSLWPLGRAARIPGAALFRDALIPERTRPSRPLLAANAAVAAA